ARGTGSLPDDLGFVVRLRDWAAIPAGVGIAIAAGLILSPISNLVDENQDVVDELNNATGAKLVVFALIAGLAAPVFEELLFRGLLLRSLLAKFSPLVAIAISATAFGTVHLLDFSLGTVVVLPALIAFGAISAHQAVKTGDLSRSILLHVGFNLPAVIGALF
ncbi:MAG: CPBP family intramembrane glutamic endopeptidase, partial [Actinomycetota bacterium]|nr:CPBP family intramembrane glutamic endopeptidase [Actinomycetota bacterium]